MISISSHKKTSSARVPKSVLTLFWEYDKRSISWSKDKDLITKKILRQGSWEDVCWLRSKIDDDELRSWLISHDGAGLDAKQLRYWQLILGIPGHVVNKWIQFFRENPWSRRMGE